MFDASVIANVLHISYGFHTAPFAIMASHTVSRRVTDCSVALAASCSSVVVSLVGFNQWPNDWVTGEEPYASTMSDK